MKRVHATGTFDDYGSWYEEKPYFEVCGNDDLKSICTTCKDKVSRGSSVRKSYNMTNLYKHLS